MPTQETNDLAKLERPNRWGLPPKMPENLFKFRKWKVPFPIFCWICFFPPPFQKPNRKSLVLLELGPTKGPFKGPFSSPDSGPQGYSYTAPVWMGEFGQMLRGSYWLNMLSTFGEDLLFFFWPFWESGSGVMLMLMLLMLMLMLLDGCISYYI